MNEEIWKDIPGWEGLYQISNIGRVKSLERRRTYINKCGHEVSIHVKEKIRKLAKRSSGHLFVSLCKDGKATIIDVHQLVALAFLGPRPKDKPHIRHLNCIPDDNRLENLTYGTVRENRTDEYRFNRGGRQKIPIEDIPVIRDRLANGERLCDLAREYNVSIQAMWQIRERVHYGWVE